MKPKSINVTHNKKISPFSYWVIPNQIAAGEYPGNQFTFDFKSLSATFIHTLRGLYVSKFKFWNTTKSKISSLLDSGINVFIDLTEEGEKPSYLSELHRERRKRSIQTKYYRFPIKDRSVPRKELVHSVMQVIDLETKNGNGVYIHCFRGLGRTGTIVGCYMAATGNSAGTVVKELNLMRKGLAGDFRKSPETQEQIRFVESWKS